VHALELEREREREREQKPLWLLDALVVDVSFIIAILVSVRLEAKGEKQERQ
jgi:hypothetical protein